jgi:glutamate dehydrogenase
MSPRINNTGKIMASSPNKKRPAPEGASGQSAFHRAFYATIPASDQKECGPEKLAAVSASIRDFSAVRSKNAHLVRVHNPANSGGSVVQIVNNDMPFIVDSATAEINGRGYGIALIFHPMLDVTRDARGALTAFRPTEGALPDGYSRESYLHVELERRLSAEQCRQLEKELLNTMMDVQAATSDWRAMLARADQLISAPSFAGGHDKGDQREGVEFLSYLRSNNFTFLGYQEFRVSGKKKADAVAGSALGVLKRDRVAIFEGGDTAAKIAALNALRAPVMINKLIGQYATVHRRVPLDVITIKIMQGGELAGMHVFVGLFTSSTYSCRTGDIPIVRQKVAETITRAGFIKGSHDAKALEHILEKIPRDELFQVGVDDLYRLSMGVLGLQTRQRIALFTHLHPLGRHMSCLLYVPRDKYSTSYRVKAMKLIEKFASGEQVSHVTTLDDSPMARVLMTLRLKPGTDGKFEREKLENALVMEGREWDERLKSALTPVCGVAEAARLSDIYGRAFDLSYQKETAIENVLHDIRHLENLRQSSQTIAIEFYRRHDMAPGECRLKVYHKAQPVILSDILPVLENMGLRTASEMPFEVNPSADGATAVWIHDFALHMQPDVKIDAVKRNFEEAFLNIWSGNAENDALNKLILLSRLTWPEVRMLRAYNGFMRQARYPYSKTYVEQVLATYPDIAAELVALFKARHDPQSKEKIGVRGHKQADRIDEMLKNVQKLDHDRILRGIKTLIEKTLRTNYFQKDKPCLVLKLDSKNIPDLPLPRPHVEIFVYSARVEATHLRGGEIARGGIRWSDRHDDFRTEVLSLMKSQMVKNTVIVPVGAKGGFIVKQPPKTGGREAYQQEGINCYKIFVQGMLDITDNNVAGRQVRPKDVVCHDAFDPYLVVAADKGTATFSNIANEISVKSGHWLADAFASGGSTGYDHKEVGITARGGWEGVKRHFREMGKDIQKEPFTLIGVGDMAGDVFGNAMLLSKQIKLVGAFNHLHIFCDPEPDIAKSFAERDRLFKARGGWEAYDTKVISAGGGVFERSAKSIKLSPQIRKRFEISKETVTPDELIQAILKAEVEMIWFGGIGTFVKSSRQSHADADDKANDALRVDARDLRAKVIGEGANLGTTQLSRVEFARMGGRINTDFIDNSGGVDCSDHEVNIKILLADVMAGKKLSLPQRNKLMRDMTEDVAALVLQDNYQQTQSLSLHAMRAADDLPLHLNLVRDLEKSGMIKRSLEGLPDDESFARLEREGQGLTRPELAILLSWSKIRLYNQILESDIPDDPAVEPLLFSYFPAALQKYKAEIKKHKLKREIIATQVVNSLVNRMGSVFVASRMAKTGKPAMEVVKAYLIAVEVYGLKDIWQRIEALDGKVPADIQLKALHDIFLTTKRAVTWLLRFGGDRLNISDAVGFYGPGVAGLKKSLVDFLPASTHEALQKAEDVLEVPGMPQELAIDIAQMGLMSSASDIVHIAKRGGGDIGRVAMAYFTVGEHLGVDWLRRQLLSIRPANSWQARVIGGLMDDFYMHQATLTAAIMGAKGKKKSGINRADVIAWLEARAETIGKLRQVIDELRVIPKVELDMLVLIGQRLGQLAHAA